MKDFQISQRKWRSLMMACLAAWLGVSCGGAMQQVTHSTSTTGGNKAATLSLNESSLDFGSVQVGSSKSSNLTLSNSSASDGPSVTFSQVTASGTGFAVSTAALPIVLAPGQSTTITVTFSPKTAGAASGSLSIAVDGASDPASVPLSGTGLGPSQLGVSPGTLNFGSVTVGNSVNKSGTLSAGNSDVTVTSAAWSGQGYAVSGISFPVTIPAGKSLSFVVTFAPETAGSANGSVSFASNASNSPTKENFSGTGSQAQAQNPGTGTQHTVALSWSASTSSVSGYNTYRGTQSGGPYSRLNSAPQSNTAYSDGTVQSGQTYYYVVTSVGTDSVESDYSNEATAAVPSP